MKAVAVIAAGRVGRGGDGDALVRYERGAGELADEPAVGDLIVEHDRVAVAGELAKSAEAGPDRGDGHGPEHRGARRLVEDLEPFVDDLDVLRQAHLAVGVGRRAVADHARERNAVEVQDGGRHVRRRQHARSGRLHPGRLCESPVFFGFLFASRSGRSSTGTGWHVAQRRRHVVVIRGADDDAVARRFYGGRQMASAAWRCRELLEAETGAPLEASSAPFEIRTTCALLEGTKTRTRRSETASAETNPRNTPFHREPPKNCPKNIRGPHGCQGNSGPRETRRGSRWKTSSTFVVVFAGRWRGSAAPHRLIREQS